MQQTTERFGLNLYEGVRGTAVKILNRLDRTDAYLDKILESELKNSELSSQDKALLYEIVHGVTRWINRIDWILTGFYKGQFSKCIPNIKNSMRVALYQILFLDKIPPYAAINEAVEFVKKLQGQKPADLTNAVLRNILRSKNSIRYPNPDEDLAGYFSVYYSHPLWMVKKWLGRYTKEFTEELLIKNNHKPYLALRVNKLKTSKEELENLLISVKLDYTKGYVFDEFLILDKLTNITDWEYFKSGYFSIQDESTAFSVKLLDPKPGMRVLDLCAAPGGKSFAIAEMMENEGEIIALDLYDARLKTLNDNLNRLGINIVKTKKEDAEKYIDEPFDRIIADVPCSGLGTITKKPDIKWRRDMGDIRNLNKIQYSLLQNGAKLLKKDGVIVYSTCTIEPEENFEIVKKFLNNNEGFELISAGETFPEFYLDMNNCVQTYPHKHHIDGAFAAKIKRVN